MLWYPNSFHQTTQKEIPSHDDDVYVDVPSPTPPSFHPYVVFNLIVTWNATRTALK
jgi:hypothetical protein